MTSYQQRPCRKCGAPKERGRGRQICQGCSAVKCRIRLCERSIRSNGYCSAHNLQIWKYGRIKTSVIRPPTPIRIPPDVATRDGLCGCGCGGTTPISTRTNVSAKLYRGFPSRFMPGHGSRKGGTITTSGYKAIRLPLHPDAHNGSGYVLEHRIVMENLLGRPLMEFENVHHINGIKTDNSPRNLELWTRPQMRGQRVSDLVAWVIDHYMPEIEAELAQRRAPT